MIWYNALQRLGVESKLLWYPVDAHPLASIECDADVFVNVSLWFSRHLAQFS
jgi:hypothetical protein